MFNKFFIKIIFFILILVFSNTKGEKFTYPEYSIAFDVVEKKLITDNTIPILLVENIQNWFSNRFKLNGFNGDLIFNLANYEEIESLTNKQKNIEILIRFSLNITKDQFKEYSLNGQVRSFGSISGNFSINEYENLKINVQNDLIARLSKEIEKNI